MTEKVTAARVVLPLVAKEKGVVLPESLADGLGENIFFVFNVYF